MKPPAPAPRARCPICGRPRQEPYRPFCSPTCRDRDLIKWLEGRYAIPVSEGEPDTPDDESERS